MENGPEFGLERESMWPNGGLMFPWDQQRRLEKVLTTTIPSRLNSIQEPFSLCKNSNCKNTVLYRMHESTSGK